MAKRKAGNAGIPWLTLATGMALGVALTLGARRALDFFAPGVTYERADSITYENPEAQELSFRFFDMLTQSDVIDTTLESGQPLPRIRVPETSAPAPMDTQMTQTQMIANVSETAAVTTPVIELAPPEVAGSRFLLQAGSFRGADKAETLRARILLLGLPCRTQQVTVQGGGVWHRVFVGPYDTKQQMERAAGQLRAEDIDPLPLYRSA